MRLHADLTIFTRWARALDRAHRVTLAAYPDQPYEIIRNMSTRRAGIITVMLGSLAFEVAFAFVPQAGNLTSWDMPSRQTYIVTAVAAAAFALAATSLLNREPNPPPAGDMLLVLSIRPDASPEACGATAGMALGFGYPGGLQS